GSKYGSVRAASRSEWEGREGGEVTLGDDDRPLGLDIDQLLTDASTDSEPVIGGLLTEQSCGWIAGEEKLGKTFYAMHEALCVALGERVCGRFNVPKRRRTLFIEEEDSQRRAGRRLRALLRGLGRDPDDPAVRTDLASWFKIDVWTGLSL